MERGNGFWRDLRKDQDHERQRQGGDRNAGVAKKSDSNDCRDSRGQNVDQIVANQNQPDQSVGSLQESDGSSRSAVTRPLEMPQTVAVERHHARLRARKERGDQNENCQRRE